MVWQLVKVNGSSPSIQTEFPIQREWKASNFRKNLKGVTQSVKDYIKTVQPCEITELEYHPNFGRVSKGLAMLNEICNRDKHRQLVVADAHWVGIRSLNNLNFIPVCQLGDEVDVVLENGNVLVNRTNRFSEHEHLEFVVAPFFSSCGDGPSGTDTALTVSETLDMCIDSVEMVVNRLRKEF